MSVLFEVIFAILCAFMSIVFIVELFYSVQLLNDRLTMTEKGHREAVKELADFKRALEAHSQSITELNPILSQLNTRCSRLSERCDGFDHNARCLNCDISNVKNAQSNQGKKLADMSANLDGISEQVTMYMQERIDGICEDAKTLNKGLVALETKSAEQMTEIYALLYTSRHNMHRTVFR